MEQASPARLYATSVGTALVALGIVGFFYSASFGRPGSVDQMLGVFAVNGWDNVLHVITGALGLLVAGYAARQYAIWIGALYVVVAAWGFVVGSGDSILRLLPVDAGDDILHLAIGALGLAAAAGTPAKDTSVAAPA